MTNLDKAAEAIRSRYPSFDPLSANGIAQALEEAGLLKTEIEENELSRLYGMEMVVERGIRKGWLNEHEFEDYL